MRIVVIGLGSMGKRRIRLMKELYPDYEIVGVDGRSDRREEAGKLFDIECLDTINKVKGVDCAFVCTSPLSHSGLIRECLMHGWNVFTELNLVSDGYRENMDLAEKMDKTLFLSSTFLYREEIRYIQNKVADHEKWNYSYHIGQYLPDWHPWENYKEFFLGEKKTNGCREILAIELPWLVETFGEVEEINVLSDKLTGLNIDYNDNYIIQILHKNGSKGALLVDVVSPVAVRKLEVYTEGAYIAWDGTPDSVVEYDADNKKVTQVKLMEQAEHIEGYRAFIVENAYKNEIQEFFAVIEKKTQERYGFEQDLKILKIIDEIGA